MPDSEAQVVRWLIEHLVREGLGRRSVDSERLVVDRHPSYTASSHNRVLKPYYGRPRIAKRTADVLFVLQEPRREYIVAVEVKKDPRQYEKGITQAAEYRRGVHDAYLCIPSHADEVGSGLRFSAETMGGGILCVSPERVEVAVRPATITPDPETLHTTEHYLSERRVEKAFGLNYPLNYAAALMATVDSSAPKAYMEERWGLSGGSINHAFIGAETLGLISEEGPTHMGRAYAEAFAEMGFKFETHRTYSRKGRLVKFASGIASLLRTIYQQLDATCLVIETLTLLPGASADLTALALQAARRDQGTALALFGEPNTEEPWYPTPTTVHQFKQALWHVGILRTKMAEGASNLDKSFPDIYRPSIDKWALDPRVMGEV